MCKFIAVINNNKKNKGTINKILDCNINELIVHFRTKTSGAVGIDGLHLKKINGYKKKSKQFIFN